MNIDQKAPSKTKDTSSVKDLNKKKRNVQKWILLLVVTLISVALDQGTKHWAQVDLQYRPGRHISLIEGYLTFTYVRNPGAAWGFLSKTSSSFRLPFFIAISLVAMTFIVYLFIRLEPHQRLLTIALSLVMSGAIGNFIDRIRYNYVVDFIDFHIGQHFRWPTFNVADIAITCGVILMFIEMFIMPKYRERPEKKHSASPELQTDPPGESKEDHREES